MYAQARNLRSAFCLAGLCVAGWGLFANSAVGQVATGSIYGTVSDSSGAVISGATVIATNGSNAWSQTTQTDASGHYSFLVIDPGVYEVAAKSAQFQSQAQRDVRVAANQNVHVSFTLSAGRTQQGVIVEAQTALVDTRESQIGTTIDHTSIESLPLNGRNAYDLVQTAPGATNYIPDTPIGSRVGTQITVNGISRGTAFYLDGAYNTDVQTGGNLLPSPDALSELRVLTSNFDAEFGRLAGGVVSIITRSGTNQYHGLAYDYLRNNVLNAKNWFLTSVTPLRQNQFGGNVGGPIPRTDDRAVFFLSYQGLVTRQPANVSSSSLITPTAQERTGDFTNTPQAFRPNISCSGVEYKICPALLDPVAQNALTLVPVGRSSPGPDYGHPPEQAANGNVDASQGTARVDARIGDDHQLSGLYFVSRGTANNPTLGGNQILGYAGMESGETQYNVVASDTWTISSTKVNSVRAYYIVNHYVVENLHHGYMLPDLGSLAASGSELSTQPRFTIAGYWQMGTNQVGPADARTSILGISDTLQWARGRHELKSGGAFLWIGGANRGAGASNGLFTFDGAATGNALVDFLLGNASLTQNNGVLWSTHALDPSVFMQESYRLTPRLTVNLGLRWEHYPPYAGQNNTGTFVAGVQSVRFPSAPLGLLTSGDHGILDGILHTPWDTFAPRIGFAYDMFGNGKASLRGAYGIYYSALDQPTLAALVQQPFTRSVTVSRTPNLVTPFAPAPDPFPYKPNSSTAVFLSGAAIFSLPPRVKNIPSVQQFSLGVQQQYGVRWNSEVDYLGNLSRHLYIAFDQNSPIYDPSCTRKTCGTTTGQNMRRPYQPTPATYVFSSISLSAPIANASYHSLQATLSRQFDRRFSLQASVVWSKAIGYGPLTNAYDPRSSRGVLDADVPYSFEASYIFMVPNAHISGRWGRHLTNGWQISGVTNIRSGQPFNVLSGIDTNFDGNNNDRPNVIAHPYFGAGRSRAAKVEQYFNTAAFIVPPAGTPYGNAAFNMLYGPGYVDTDLSASKTMTVTREGKVQFRCDAFNVFDNVNLNAPNSTKTSPAFGRISAAAAPRILQLALRLTF